MDINSFRWRKVNQHLLEQIVEQFFANMFLNNIDSIIFKWGQYAPIIGSNVVTFQYLLETVLFSPFIFAINPDTIELFSERPTLKINRSSLDKASQKFIDLMEKHDDKFFGTKRTENTIPPCFRYRSFYFDKVAEKTISRNDILIKIIYKLLMVCLEDLHHNAFFDICIFIITVLNTIIAKQYTLFLQDNNNTLPDSAANKAQRKLPAQDILLAIIRTLKDPSALRNILLPHKNIYDVTT